MTERERPADPGRDGALTIAARLFGDERHIPRRTCLGCGGAGRGRGAVSWECDGSGPTVNGDWSAEFHAWSAYQYAAEMFKSGHSKTDPGPAPTKPTRGTYHDWTYTFSWSQIRERAEALAVGEQTGAFEAIPDATPAPIAPEPAPEPGPECQVRGPEPEPIAAEQMALRL